GRVRGAEVDAEVDGAAHERVRASGDQEFEGGGAGSSSDGGAPSDWGAVIAGGSPSAAGVSCGVSPPSTITTPFCTSCTEPPSRRRMMGFTTSVITRPSVCSPTMVASQSIRVSSYASPSGLWYSSPYG